MSAALAILLSADADAPPEWWLVEDATVTAHAIGEDWPEVERDRADGDLPVTLMVPARATTVHRATLPSLAPRQAAAAARLMALENSVGPPETIHVAAGPRDADGGLDIAVADAAAMAEWLRWAQHSGLDPVAVVPAALLLPRPDEGFVRGEVGGESILRDATSAFVDDGLGEAIVGDAQVRALAVDEIEAAIAEAARVPPLDLRQGVFARRRRPAIDWALVQRAALLAGLTLLSSLAIALVRIARLNASTGALEATTVATARRVVPGVSTADQAQAAVNAKLVQRGLGGRGFAAPAAQLFVAMQAAPAVSVAQLQRSGDGALAVTLTGARREDIDAVLLAVQQAGYRVAADAPQNQGGQVAVPVTVAVP